MPVSWLVNGHLKKLGKKVDKHKQDILKWRNGVGERIEQKLAATYKKMGCIAAVECYSLMLGEYSVELTNSRKLAVWGSWVSRLTRAGSGKCEVLHAAMPWLL